MVIGDIVASDLLFKERKDQLDWYLPINGKQHNIIKVSLYYDLGGMNYFSGTVKPRGYYLSIIPMMKTATSESHTLLGKDSGGYVLLQETKRFNKNKMLELIPRVADEADQYVKHFKTKFEEKVNG